MNKTTKNILRWIAVPFACVLGDAVGFWLPYLVNYLSGDLSWPYADYPIMAICGGFSGALFVIAGSYTAPSHQRTTSIVLATLRCIIAIAALVVVCISREDGWILHIVRGGATVIGAIIASVHVHGD